MGLELSMTMMVLMVGRKRTPGGWIEQAQEQARHRQRSRHRPALPSWSLLRRTILAGMLYLHVHQLYSRRSHRAQTPSIRHSPV